MAKAARKAYRKRYSRKRYSSPRRYWYRKRLDDYVANRKGAFRSYPKRRTYRSTFYANTIRRGDPMHKQIIGWRPNTFINWRVKRAVRRLVSAGWSAAKIAAKFGWKYGPGIYKLAKAIQYARQAVARNDHYWADPQGVGPATYGMAAVGDLLAGGLSGRGGGATGYATYGQRAYDAISPYAAAIAEQALNSWIDS